MDSAKLKEHFEDCEHFFGVVISKFGISHTKKGVFSISRMLGSF